MMGVSIQVVSPIKGELVKVDRLPCATCVRVSIQVVSPIKGEITSGLAM